jgi:hypothetical protein
VIKVGAKKSNDKYVWINRVLKKAIFEEKIGSFPRIQPPYAFTNACTNPCNPLTLIG